MDGTRDLENDPRAERSDHRHIAGEMDHVAQSLVCMQQDGLAFNGLVAEPERLRQVEPRIPRTAPFVLLRGLGHAFVTADVPVAALRDVLSA